MKLSTVFRIIFFVIVAVFVLNFVVLLVYFPLSTSSSAQLAPAASSLALNIKNREPFAKPREENLRKKHRQQQQLAPFKDDKKPQNQKGALGRKQRTNATAKTIAKHDNNNNKTGKCPSYGCPLYPPELTNPKTNQTIWEALESSGYSFPMSSSSNAKGSLSSEFGFGFASKSFATLSQQGKSHKVNQDRGVYISPFLPDLMPTEKSFLVCIFDGHGQLGHKVAQEVVEKFPLLLSEKLTQALGNNANNFNNHARDPKPNGNKNETILVSIEDYDSTDLAIRKALNETFLEVNEKGTPSTFLLGGCTASVTLRWGSKLYVANAGDSETIVVSALPPSKQQTPRGQQQQDSMIAKVEYNTRRDKANQPAERSRIEKLGGKIHVNAMGFDPRVIVHSEAAHDTIGLAMSRSIGDWEWKAVGVTAEPTIDLIDLSKLAVLNPERTFFLLAASDGWWDMRQKHLYATRMAPSFRNRNEISQNQRDMEDANTDFRPLYHLYDMMQRITPKVQKGYCDDITATIVNLE